MHDKLIHATETGILDDGLQFFIQGPGYLYGDLIRAQRNLLIVPQGDSDIISP